jgi:hypothetical protein
MQTGGLWRWGCDKHSAATRAATAARYRTGRRCSAQTPFELSDARQKLVERQQGRAASESHQRHLEPHARLLASYDVVERVRESLETTQ